MTRRDWLLTAGAGLATLCTQKLLASPVPLPSAVAPEQPGPAQAQLVAQLAAIERRSGGRLGVAVLDTGSGTRLGWREHERFALCSTFKLLLAAWVLSLVDQGQASLTQRLHYPPSEVLPYAPISGPHAGAAGMTVAELCAATVSWSDNTAANVLLRQFGGPAALTGFLRAQGDAVTRLDRWEPELNQVAGDDVRDTTTPLAMLRSVQHLVLGPALGPNTRPFLQHWLRDCRTGDGRIRAGAPGWTVGDKTGTGEQMSHDVAVLWPPGPRSAPWVMSCYLSQAPGPMAERDSVIATVTRTLLEGLQAHRA